MLRKMLSYFTLPLLLLLSNSSGNSAPQAPEKSPEGQTGTLEKMIVASGNVAMDLDLNRLNGTAPGRKNRNWTPCVSKWVRILFSPFLSLTMSCAVPSRARWGSSRETPRFFLHRSMRRSTNSSSKNSRRMQLLTSWCAMGKRASSFSILKDISMITMPRAHLLSIKGGRLLISEEFAQQAWASGGRWCGRRRNFDRDDHVSDRNHHGRQRRSCNRRSCRREQWQPECSGICAGARCHRGRSAFHGDNLEAAGTQVGLGVGTTSCNNGDVELDWFALPNTDHPVIPQNLYRMSGGASNNDRFEQIGQSWLKHAFAALQDNACGFGCTPAADGTHLGVGCSDPYGASLNASQSGLGSRAWVNPFTGAFPSTAARPLPATRTPARSHRILVEMSDLNTTLNPGATYYAEGSIRHSA